MFACSFPLDIQQQEYYLNLKISTFNKISAVILKNSDILFGSEYKREIYISQAADNNSFLVRWNERVVIMHSYAELLR